MGIVWATEKGVVLSVWKSQGAFRRRKQHLNCFEGWERAVRLRKAGARKAIRAGEIAWMCMKRFTFVLTADFKFSPQFSLLSCGGERVKRGRKSWSFLGKLADFSLNIRSNSL